MLERVKNLFGGLFKASSQKAVAHAGTASSAPETGQQIVTKKPVVCRLICEEPGWFINMFFGLSGMLVFIFGMLVGLFATRLY